VLALFLIVAPWQSYAHGACADEEPADVTQAEGSGAVFADNLSADEPCDGANGCSCCNFLCMQHCSASSQGIVVAFDGLASDSFAALWHPARTLGYVSVILPTDTRPPQISV